MFKKGDVYTIEGKELVRWVGVLTKVDKVGSATAIEICYNKVTGQFIAVEAAAYFSVDRPGQRVLLQVATKEEAEDV
ncbi:hypothetical protein LCGC14_0878680 [marine sediment metagenome]|uniref:Uncharacterized protein n=1 Tax=marine sediment metagenome TaxID=412755 RepID=A0A0F9S9I2_9ZZZZ